VSLLGDRLLIGPEARGSFDLTKADLVPGPLARDEALSAEARLGAQFRFLGAFVVGAAGGVGIANAVGTPEFRLLSRLAFDPQGEEKPEDRDGDGVPDEVDACATVAGVASTDPRKNGCPPDQDGDGILVAQDACVDIAGVKSADPKRNGCPDRDGDGVLDATDECPTMAGLEPTGCPDTDGDGILDPKDACPLQKGIASKDPEKNGCPKVVLTAKEIVFNDTIEFELGKAKLLPSSDEIIDAVFTILRDNTDIQLIEVQGHTDDQGPAAMNRVLSQRRAGAVSEVLVKKGIDAKRIVSKGYGPDKPLVNEKTEAARAKNRRVQFLILKRDAAKIEAVSAPTSALAPAAAAKPAATTAAPAPAAPTPAPAPAAPAPSAKPAAPAPAAPTCAPPPAPRVPSPTDL
jgi:outer membrane protein OmpA-like peptidoglycan-associated protein